MKQFNTYIHIMVMLLTMMLTACSDSVVNDTPSTSDAEDGYYTAHFSIAIPSFEEPETTRSTVFMNEGIRSKDDLKLFCFDNEGQFVGFGEIQDFNPIIGLKRHEDGSYEIPESSEQAKQDNTGVSGGGINKDGSSEERDFTAKIPNNTSRIHLVANATKQYQTINFNDQWKWVGMHENILMTTFETNHTENQDVMTRYWGYIKKDSPSELKDYLDQSKKKADYIIHLIRDRAKISADWSEEAKEKNPNLVNDFKLSVFNGVAYGTLAPFNRNELVFDPTTGDKNWVWKVDYVTPAMNTTRLKGDNGQMYNPTAAFEENNLPTDPTKVTMSHGGKYYLIYLQDKDNKPYAIKRNYEYKIIIDQLDESYGKGSSEEAIKGAPVNNPWITVEQIVPGVSDGNHELAIIGGTYKTINSGANTEQSIQFTYKGEDAAQKQPSDFVVTWTKNLAFGTADAPKIESYSYDNSKNVWTGTITYKLGAIDNTWREGVIHLIDKVHGLNKNIHLFSVNEANYQFNGPTNIGTAKGSEGDFLITIPSDYPDELLPVNLKIASNDVTPENLEVEVSDTQKETNNECKTNNWFKYKAEVIKRSNEGEEIPGSRNYTYTIKLKNVRNATSGSKGCFWLKADNFNQGKAKKIEFTYK